MIKTAINQRRRGISLIEVLFAMGVLSVGILAMAALLPLGVYELAEADKLDQTSTLGRAAFRDLEIRCYLQPKMWVDTQVGMLIEPTINPDPDTAGTYNLFPPGAGARLVAYPYLPPRCYTSYVQALQPAASPVYSVPQIPQISTQPQLFPLPFNPPAAAAAPIGVSMMKMYNPTSIYPPYNPPTAYSSATYPPFPPFAATDAPLVVLDPLMVGAIAPSNPGGFSIVPSPSLPPSPKWTSIQTFPYQPTYLPAPPVIPRLTLLPGQMPQFSPSFSPPAAAAQTPMWPLWNEGVWTQPRIMPFAAADRIFRSTDDIAFNPLDPTDRTYDRPTRSMNYDSGVGTPLPPQVQYQGNYSWFVTIGPSLSETDSTVKVLGGSSDAAKDPVLQPDTAALTTARQFTASVVVCQNRVLDVTVNPAADFRPSEWMVPAKLYGGGIGGGEATLYIHPNSAQTAMQANWLAGVRPGSWLMLSGITISAEIRTDNVNYYYWPKFKSIANWYRIVAVDDGSALSPTGGSLNVTLAGADWPQGIQWDDPAVNGTGQGPPVQFAASPPPQGVQFAILDTLNYSPAVQIYSYATIIEGVVGVYQKTITFDGDSLFSSH